MAVRIIVRPFILILLNVRSLRSGCVSIGNFPPNERVPHTFIACEKMTNDIENLHLGN